ncbi:MAG: c-type cytochrome [Solirubrobacterales bacterium]
MNNAEKQAYLQEYEQLKKQGKPFFPYAVLKDAVMMVVVVAVVIVLTLVLGAELGPKADPTTTTYVPRPDWYFFFLFEVLRVLKPPALVPLATIGVPTICMVLLILLPFFDRGPERNPLKRPIATTAAIMTIVAMAYLTVLGATAGFDIELDIPADQQAGKEVAQQSGCVACHHFGDAGGVIGPDLTEVGDKLPRAALARTLVNPTSPMPSYAKLQQEEPEKFNDLLDFLTTLR